MEEKPIQVKTIVVRTGRIVCDIEIPNPAFRMTSPKLAAFVTNQYPDLPLHACVNDIRIGHRENVDSAHARASGSRHTGP